MIEVTLVDVRPGPDLASMLDTCGLQSRQTTHLTDHDLVEALCAAHRIGAWAAALELAAISELDRRRVAEARAHGSSEALASEFLIDEVAMALAMTDSAAAIRAAVAHRLSHSLADTFTALAEGLIDFDKARTISDAVTGLSEADARAVQDEVLEPAERATTGQLRALLRKALSRIAPEEKEARKKKAEATRRLELWPTDDGTADLSLRDLPEADAHACYNKINAMAQACRSDGDPRPIDMLRADTLVTLIRGFPLPTSVLEVATQHTDVPKPPNPKKSSRPQPSNPTPAPESARPAEATRHLHAQLANALAALTATRQVHLAAEAGERIQNALQDLATQWCSTTHSPATPTPPPPEKPQTPPNPRKQNRYHRQAGPTPQATSHRLTNDRGAPERRRCHPDQLDASAPTPHATRPAPPKKAHKHPQATKPKSPDHQ